MNIDKDKIEQDMLKMISLQQSEKQTFRSFGAKSLTFISERYRGTCSLCKRDTWIVKKREELCNLCYQWCRRWIKKKYGAYCKNKIGEAMAAFLQPQPCRFFSSCGNYINMVENGRVRRSSGNICDRCLKIFVAGYKLGVATKKAHTAKGQGVPLHDRFH